MIRSFIETAYSLDETLLSVQSDGWKVISVTPTKEKRWSRESKMYVDKNLFVVIVENEKFKPVRKWVVNDKEYKEFSTKEKAYDYAKSNNISDYFVGADYDCVEVEEDV